jgi:hypothetical protein
MPRFWLTLLVLLILMNCRGLGKPAIISYEALYKSTSERNVVNFKFNLTELIIFNN